MFYKKVAAGGVSYLSQDYLETYTAAAGGAAIAGTVLKATDSYTNLNTGTNDPIIPSNITDWGVYTNIDG